MARHPTVGFEIYTALEDSVGVVAGDLLRPVPELHHAPKPLNGIQEIVFSANYSQAARRYLREMESKGVNPSEIIQRMNEPTPFFRITISAEFAELPANAALKATTPAQQRICQAALLVARRRDVEGFTFANPHFERPRFLFLSEAIERAVKVIDCHHFAPAHLLAPGIAGDLGDLFRFGR